MSLKYSTPRATGTNPTGAQVRRRITDSSGFSLIELLVVILIIGLLCAIAIPSFVNQKSKAVNAQAKELARSAETSAETISTQDSGSYENVTLEEINKVEPTIQVRPSTSDPYLSATTHGLNEYSVTVKATDGDEFTITKNSSGEVSRECVSRVSKTGCSGRKKASW